MPIDNRLFVPLAASLAGQEIREPGRTIVRSQAGALVLASQAVLKEDVTPSSDIKRSGGWVLLRQSNQGAPNIRRARFSAVQSRVS